jgi:predicted DNA-binding transcriptional regulator AlpA
MKDGANSLLDYYAGILLQRIHTVTIREGSNSEHNNWVQSVFDFAERMAKESAARHEIRGYRATKDMLTPPKVMRIKDVCAYLSISRSGWYAGIKSGCFPEGTKLGKRLVVWDADVIAALTKRAAS